MWIDQAGMRGGRAGVYWGRGGKGEKERGEKEWWDEGRGDESYEKVMWREDREDLMSILVLNLIKYLLLPKLYFFRVADDDKEADC